MKNGSSLDLRKSIKASFELFLETLEDKEDVDSMDLYLMGCLVLGEFTREKVIEKTKKLSKFGRNEIAIYYLMNFALFDSLSDPSPYYRKAKKLGCTEAGNKLSYFNKDKKLLTHILNMKPLPTLKEDSLNNLDNFTYDSSRDSGSTVIGEGHLDLLESSSS